MSLQEKQQMRDWRQEYPFHAWVYDKWELVQNWHNFRKVEKRLRKRGLIR